MDTNIERLIEDLTKTAKRKRELEDSLSVEMKEIEKVEETNAQKKRCIREMISDRLSKIKTEVEDFTIKLEEMRKKKREKKEEARQLDESMYNFSYIKRHTHTTWKIYLETMEFYNPNTHIFTNL